MGKGSLAKGTLAERIRGDAQVQRVRRAHAGTILCRLLAQLQAREQDKFAAHLYRSRREYDWPANGQARVKAMSGSHPSDISDRRENGFSDFAWDIVAVGD
jgi:hypothetical protein